MLQIFCPIYGHFKCTQGPNGGHKVYYYVIEIILFIKIGAQTEGAVIVHIVWTIADKEQWSGVLQSTGTATR